MMLQSIDTRGTNRLVVREPCEIEIRVRPGQQLHRGREIKSVGVELRYDRPRAIEMVSAMLPSEEPGSRGDEGND